MKPRRLLALLSILLLLWTSTASASVLTLPTSLKSIDSYAFRGSTALDEVVLPEGITSIGAYAFADSSLTSINLPSSITYISDTSFSGCDDVVISATTDSYAYNWAVGKGLNVAVNAVNYRALLIGNTYPGTISELPGPDNDVDGMQTMLNKQTHTPYDITKKINITGPQIEQAIYSTFADADENDVSLFFYSGHGTSYGEIVGTGGTYIAVSDLRRYLDKIPGKKVVLLDCCYSGAYIDKGDDVETVDFDEAVINVFSATPRGNLATEDYIVMTACTQKQTASSLSYGSMDGSVYWFGAFTYSLVYGSGFNMFYHTSCPWWADYMGNNDGNTSLGEAYNDAVDTVKNILLCRHTPQFYGDSSFVLWSK